jgi:hypothetical protein
LIIIFCFTGCQAQPTLADAAVNCSRKTASTPKKRKIEEVDDSSEEEFDALDDTYDPDVSIVESSVDTSIDTYRYYHTLDIINQNIIMYYSLQCHVSRSNQCCSQTVLL